MKRVKEGYEEQLGRDSEKAFDVTRDLIMITCSSKAELIEKFRDLLKRCERALGEENFVTLKTLNSLGVALNKNEECEEAKEIFGGSLAGRTKVLGEDHKNTLMTVGNLGNVYSELKNDEKAMEYYERALEGQESTLGKTRPNTLMAVINIVIIYDSRLKDYGKAEELYERALVGYEARSLGKTIKIRNFARRTSRSAYLRAETTRKGWKNY